MDRDWLVSSSDLCGVKKAGAVVQRQEVNIVLSDSIDDAVAADDDLSDVSEAQFRNDSARTWKALQ